MAANAYRTPTPGPLGDRPYGGDYDAALTTRPFILWAEAGTAKAYLWVDATGDLRIKATAPTSDTDGTVVGSQS